MADENNIEIGVGINATKATSGAATAKTAVGGISSEAKGLESAFRRLKSAIDPTWAAQEKFNKTLADNRTLFREGMISGQEFAQGMAAARAELNATKTALEQNSAAAREQAQAMKQAALDKAAAERQAAEQIKAAAREAAAVQKAEARAAAAEIKAQKAAERAAVQLAATEAKAAAREIAQAEKAAAAESAAAIKAAKAQDRQATRDAATAAAQAARDRLAAERLATSAAREAAEATRREAVEAKNLANVERELRSSIDSTYAAQQRYNDTMRAATQLLMQGKLQQGEFTRIQKVASTQMEINARSTGRLNTGYVQLGYQAQDVAASLASGINPLVILAQQGGQTASAIANMGGRFASVAAFIAGPWGVAITAVVAGLGYLIYKMMDSTSAADTMAASQANLKNYIDATTGSINAQTTALERRAAARIEDAVAANKAEDIANARQRMVTQGLTASTPGTNNAFSKIGMAVMGQSAPADITNGKSAAQVKAWSKELNNGSLSVSQFADKINELGKTDKDVARLAKTMDTLGSAAVQADRDASTARARSKQYSGQALNDAERKLLGVKTTEEQLGTSYLDAAATYATATDTVVKAQANETMVKAKADIVRKQEIADGKSAAEANRNYAASIQPAVAATIAATNAKKEGAAATRAATKADNEAAREAKRAAEEKLRYDLEDLDYKKELAREDFTEVMRLQDAKLERLKGYYGTDNRNYVMALREKERLTRQHAELLLNIELERIKRQADAEMANATTDNKVNMTGLGAGADVVDTMGRLGQLNGRQQLEAKRAQLAEEYAMQQQHEERMYQLKLKSLQDQVKLLDAYPERQREVNGQIAALQLEHENTIREMTSQNYRDVQKINLEVVENAQQNWKRMTSSVADSMSQMFQGIWMHSGNFRDNMLNIADQLVFKYVNMGLELAADWAANELAKTASSLTGIGVRTAAEAGSEGTKTAAAAAGTASRTALTATETGADLAAVAATTGATVAAEAVKTGAKATGTAADISMTATAGMAEIGTRAATSAAGAFSSTVVIPFIGPVAAPVAAAAALAAVMGFGALISAKGGLDEVPSDQLAMVHKKEMILPAWIAEPLRNTLKSPRSMAPIASGASMGGAAARSATHNSQSSNFYYQPQNTVQTMDMETMLRKDGGMFKKWLKNQSRNGAFRMDGNS